MKILVLDVETTGRDANRYEICEIAAVAYQDGVEVGSVSTLVLTHGKWDMETVEVHGVTPEDVRKHGRPLEEVCRRLDTWVQKCDALVAFNHRFDARFISAAFQRCGMLWVPKPWLDPSEFARRFVRDEDGLKGRKLVDMCAWLGIELSAAHEALHDTRATGALFFALVERYGIDLEAEIAGTAKGIPESAYGLPVFEAIYGGFRQSR